MGVKKKSSTTVYLVLLIVTSSAKNPGRTLSNEPFIGCLNERVPALDFIEAVKCRGVTTDFISSHLNKLKAQEILEVDCLHCKILQCPSFNQTISKIRLVSSGVKQIQQDAFLKSAESLIEIDLSGNSLRRFPPAIMNLTELEILDLSNNNITTLPEGKQFFHLWKLKVLNMAFNRLGTIQEIQERNLKGTSRPLSLTVFNLEPLREILEVLNLRGNGLKVLPEQFIRPFPRLRSLDLSGNLLSDIPLEAFSAMPDLQNLYLDNNRLLHLHLFNQPPQLKLLSLQGNRLNCTCPIVMYNKIENRSNSAEMNSSFCEANIDKLSFQILKDNQGDCFDSSLTVRSEEEKKKQLPLTMVEYNSKGRLDLEATSAQIVARWMLNATAKEIFSWSISCRLFGTKNYTEITGTQSGGSQPTGSVTFQNLTASSSYSICFKSKIDNEMHQTICEEISTGRGHNFPSSEVAIAATVSSTSTVFIIAVICCCFPCKKKKKEEKIPEEMTKNRQSQNIEYSYPTLSKKYKGLSDGYKRNCILFPEDFSYTNVGAIDTVLKEEESKKVFEETKKYLQNERVKALLNYEEKVFPSKGERQEIEVTVQCHEDSTSSGYLTPKTNDELDATLNYDLFKPKEELEENKVVSPEILQKRLSIVESLQNFKEPVPKLPISVKKRHSIEMSEIHRIRAVPPLQHPVAPAPRRPQRHHTWSTALLQPPTVRWNESYEQFLANPSMYRRRRRHTLYNRPPYMTVNRLYLVAHPSGEIRF
ncbi:uncharacterized protein LOC136033565 [Artemia franciscana]|uniref:uncharacterized protein LOC136033565 n=1 Tax=Artemia franciscana TaxID=6661 RepID=UPI0032D9E891